MSNVNVQYGQNKQLSDEDEVGKAESIGGETQEIKEICHDPTMLKTKKLFSYPRDKGIRKITVSHVARNNPLTPQELDRIFDLGTR